MTHIPRHNKLFGRTVKCIYTGQPLDEEKQPPLPIDNEQPPETNKDTTTNTDSETYERGGEQKNNITETRNINNQNNENLNTNNEEQQKSSKQTTINTNETQSTNIQQENNTKNKNRQNTNTNETQANTTRNRSN